MKALASALRRVLRPVLDPQGRKAASVEARGHRSDNHGAGLDAPSGPHSGARGSSVKQKSRSVDTEMQLVQFAEAKSSFM